MVGDRKLIRRFETDSSVNNNSGPFFSVRLSLCVAPHSRALPELGVIGFFDQGIWTNRSHYRLKMSQEFLSVAQDSHYPTADELPTMPVDMPWPGYNKGAIPDDSFE